MVLQVSFSLISLESMACLKEKMDQKSQAKTQIIEFSLKYFHTSPNSKIFCDVCINEALS